MTAFVANTAADYYFDGYSGGSVNATLDTYTISERARLIIRSDSYACPNHSAAFGSLDTVSFSGVGGTLRIDPTNVRVIAYTGGSGNAPAYGTTITANNGTTGVFLGAWTNWLSEPITPGSAIGATGFIKLGSVSSVGNFNAGALTGITATCSGADVQGWIEVRGADTATITVPRVGNVETVGPGSRSAPPTARAARPSPAHARPLSPAPSPASGSRRPAVPASMNAMPRSDLRWRWRPRAPRPS
jgi:hypothetical protein